MSPEAQAASSGRSLLCGCADYVVTGLLVLLALVVFLAAWQAMSNLYETVRPPWQAAMVALLTFFPLSLGLGPLAGARSYRRHGSELRAWRSAAVVTLVFNALFIPLGVSGM